MTRDMILVERECDGEECGESCPQLKVNTAGKRHAYCRQFGSLEMAGAKALCHTTCLATLPARVLTPEMGEAVESAVQTLDMAALAHGRRKSTAADALRAAFGIEEG